MRIESSIITSLSELRAIEQQRIAEERAAVERRRVAEIEAVRAAEQARVDAEQARVRSEREERMRVETARAEAEREARVRVEAAEAAERARLAAQLEERRMVEELELRRAEVAKKRPKWMIAVTVVAALSAMGLTAFALDRSRQTSAAQEASERSKRAQEIAEAELRTTKEHLASLQKDVDAIDTRIATLTKQLMDAQNAEERRKVQLALAAEAQAKHEAQKRIADEQAHQAWVDRHRVIDVTECAKTAVGCLKHD